MKRKVNSIAILLCCLIIGTHANSQCNVPKYKELVQSGLKFANEKDFKNALNKYNAAKLVCSERSAYVDSLIKSTYISISMETLIAKEALKSAKASELIALNSLNARNLADKALNEQRKQLQDHDKAFRLHIKANLVKDYDPVKAIYMEKKASELYDDEYFKNTIQQLFKEAAYFNKKVNYPEGLTFNDDIKPIIDEEGNVLMIGKSGVYVLDVKTDVFTPLTGYPQEFDLSNAAISTDHNLLASCIDGNSVLVYNFKTRKTDTIAFAVQNSIHIFHENEFGDVWETTRPLSLKFANNNQQIWLKNNDIYDSSELVKIDLKTKNVSHIRINGLDYIGDYIVSKDGSLAACYYDSFFRIVLDYEIQVDSRGTARKKISSLNFSPDESQLLVGMKDLLSIIYLEGFEVNTLAFDGIVSCNSYGPDGHITATSSDTTINLWYWDTIPMSADQTFYKCKQTEKIKHLVYINSGIISFSDIGYRKWDFRERVLWEMQVPIDSSYDWDGPEKFLRLDNSAIENAKYTEDGNQVYSLSNGGVFRLWDIESNALKKEFKINIERNAKFLLSPDGKYLFTKVRDKATLWDMKGTLVSSIDENYGGCDFFVFSPDSKFVITSGCESSEIRFRKVPDLSLNKKFQHPYNIKEVNLALNGMVIVGQSTYAFVFWNSNGDLLKTINVGSYLSYSISPDEKKIIVQKKDSILIINIEQLSVESSQQVKVSYFDIYQNNRISPDGDLIVSKSQNGGLWLTDSKEAKMVENLTGKDEFSAFRVPEDPFDVEIMEGIKDVKKFKHSITSLVFSPKGNCFLAGCADGYIRIVKNPLTLTEFFKKYPDPEGY